LPRLTPAELARITGGAGHELQVDLSGGPGKPVTATIGLTHQLPTGCLQGTLAASEQGWSVGLATRSQPSKHVNLEARFNTDGRNHEWGIRGSIRFLRA
jgi:hypothetical protein